MALIYLPLSLRVTFPASCHVHESSPWKAGFNLFTDPMTSLSTWWANRNDTGQTKITWLMLFKENNLQWDGGWHLLRRLWTVFTVITMATPSVSTLFCYCLETSTTTSQIFCTESLVSNNKNDKTYLSTRQRPSSVFLWCFSSLCRIATMARSGWLFK